MDDVLIGLVSCQALALAFSAASHHPGLCNTACDNIFTQPFANPSIPQHHHPTFYPSTVCPPYHILTLQRRRATKAPANFCQSPAARRAPTIDHPPRCAQVSIVNASPTARAVSSETATPSHSTRDRNRNSPSPQYARCGHYVQPSRLPLSHVLLARTHEF